jgi:peptide/nickel transport system ATP-binding protein
MTASGASPLLVLDGITKQFGRGTAFSTLFASASNSVTALDRVSLSLPAGRTLGLVGESGSGKSTLANIVLGLERPSGGRLLFEGRDIASFSKPERRRFRTRVQMIFQDPHGSLNPRFTIGRTVEEPLLVNGIGTEGERRQRALAALEDAELRPAASFVDRYPHELSGGQRQRVAIARAIVLDPALLIADEPVSMLDVSVRAGILALLHRLVTERGMGMVFITHDLSLLAQVCDEVAILYRGRLVEIGPAMSVMTAPLHPYTRQLIAAVPVPDPDYEAAGLPEARAPALEPGAAGCAFVARCAQSVDVCRGRDPVLAATGGRGQSVACHNIAFDQSVRRG